MEPKALKLVNQLNAQTEPKHLLAGGANDVSGLAQQAANHQRGFLF